MNEPLFSKRISAGTRVYYIDAHKDRKGQTYISISEIPTDAHPDKEKKRRRIFVHKEVLKSFLDNLTEVINSITDDHGQTD